MTEKVWKDNNCVFTCCGGRSSISVGTSCTGVSCYIMTTPVMERQHLEAYSPMIYAINRVLLCIISTKRIESLFYWEKTIDIICFISYFLECHYNWTSFRQDSIKTGNLASHWYLVTRGLFWHAQVKCLPRYIMCFTSWQVNGWFLLPSLWWYNLVWEYLALCIPGNN